MANCTYREFRPFVKECAKVGIGKTFAYELAKDGALETFTIGRKRFVYLDSFSGLSSRGAISKAKTAGLPLEENGK
ncbi:hypothetical protein IU514_12755 [Lysobacter niastensis]|uniref:DNA-binding protein n=1 Tax=Lysobacter niastensis TaxID=380629 RepID=A0ABS0BB50_9GAMM|nr:hypothetical protein [Lysobacter niastensis]